MEEEPRPMGVGGGSGVQLYIPGCTMSQYVLTKLCDDSINFHICYHIVD